MTPYVYITYIYALICSDVVPWVGYNSVVLWDESQDSTMWCGPWTMPLGSWGFDLSWKIIGKMIFPYNAPIFFKYIMLWDVHWFFFLPPSESNCASGFTEQTTNNVRVTVFLPKLVWVNRPQRVIDKGITMSCWPSSLSARFRGARLGFLAHQGFEHLDHCWVVSRGNQ